jgi:hypothetical protein
MVVAACVLAALAGCYNKQSGELTAKIPIPMTGVSLVEASVKFHNEQQWQDPIQGVISEPAHASNRKDSGGYFFGLLGVAFLVWRWMHRKSG